MNAENIVITGANRGIGLEFCKQLIESENPPKNLFSTCRDPTTAEELKKLKSKSSKTVVHIIKLDVSNDEQIKMAAEEVSKIVGSKGVNLLINNAGIMGEVSFPGATSQSYMEHFRVNSVAPMIISDAFLPMLKLAANKNPGGFSCNRSAIINITGLIAHFSHIDFLLSRDIEAYRMSKVALNLGSCIMARNLKESGILVLAIHPGWVETDMGGPGAQFKTDESISQMLTTLAKVGQVEHGTVIDFSGAKLAW